MFLRHSSIWTVSWEDTTLPVTDLYILPWGIPIILKPLLFLIAPIVHFHTIPQ